MRPALFQGVNKIASLLFIVHPQMGHLNPTLKLARALKGRGHKVCYLGIPDFKDYVRNQGLDFVPIFEDLCPEGFIHSQAGKKFDNLATLLLQARRAGRTGATSPLNDIQEALRRIQPDLLVVDAVLRDLALMAVKVGVPFVFISMTLAEGHMKLVESNYSTPVESPVLIFCPREFDFPNAAARRGRFHIEASIDLERKEPAFAWHTIDESKPLLYCSLGSQSHQYEQGQSFFQRVMEAMREREGWEAILATGTHLSLDDHRPAPRNVHIMRWAPQLEVLKRASVMINNGALGSIKDCIYFGVPMIVFPVRWEQPDNAARVVHHRLGLRGNIDTVSAAEVGSMIDRIHNDASFKARVRRMGEKFRQIEGSGVGVRIIESILASSSNPRNLVTTQVYPQSRG